MNEPGADTPIELMIRHEMAVHTLYVAFAEQLPGLRVFWEELAREEAAHASHIRHLAQQLGRGVVRFNERQLNRAALISSLDYLAKRTKDAHDKGVTAIRALSFAADVEQSLLEQAYFAVFESDSSEVKNVLDNLRTETEQHLDRVRSMHKDIVRGTSR